MTSFSRMRCLSTPPTIPPFITTFQVKLNSKTESEILMRSQKKIKAKVQSLARSLRNDWKLGIGAPPTGKGATAG